MPAFTTYPEAHAELIATVDYDVENSASKCRRFIAACRALLLFASNSSGNGSQIQFDQRQVANQLSQAQDWLGLNDTSATEAQQLANAAAIGADFSGLRGGST